MLDADNRKPCLALMGEFSAGKSTLANLLIGHNPLPVQVIATQLPPVRISYGDASAFRVALDGTVTPVDLETLHEAALDDTEHLQIYSTEEMLKHCDLMDMPGISDPNTPAETWQRMIGKVDGVLWCTPATQAWRQSEAAVWADLPAELYQHSLLLVTRMDKLVSDEDRNRVLTRVRKETAGRFADVLPISLTDATRIKADPVLWQQCGAEAFAARLSTIIAGLNPKTCEEESGVRLAALDKPTLTEESSASLAPKVIPRRVVARESQRPRPA